MSFARLPPADRAHPRKRLRPFASGELNARFTRRVFRAMLRKMIVANALPDYMLEEEPGDILRVTPRDSVIEAAGRPIVSSEALEQARMLMPGCDVYALEAEWRGWWADTGRPRLRSPDRAFLGWVRARLARIGQGSGD